MAVTANQVVKRQSGCRSSVPVYQSVAIYEGTLVFINSSGYAVGTVASGANPFLGVAIREADNSSGSDGDKKVEVETDGVFELQGSGFSQATVGLDIYASDNFTVTTTSTATSYVGKCVGYVSSTKILVQVRRYAPTSPLADDSSGTTAATFQVDSDLGKPRAALGSQTGGTGDYLGIILPPSTMTANRNYTLPADSAQTLVGATATQTLTNKTLGAGTLDIRDAQTLTPNSSAGAGNSITAGMTQVVVGAPANNADDFIVLPAIAGLEIGHQIRIACNGGSNFELRTPASSNTKINDVDADGSQEYLCTDTDLIIVTKHTTTGWVAQSLTKLGAVRTAVVPD